MNQFTKSSVFSVCDATQGFFQIEYDDESMQYTGFVTRKGVFKMRRLMQGSKTSPSIFHRVFGSTLPDDDEFTEHTACGHWIDDAALTSQTEETHFNLIAKFLRNCKEQNVWLNPLKSKWFGSDMVWCGRHVTKGAWKYEKNPADKFVEQRPENLKELSELYHGLG